MFIKGKDGLSRRVAVDTNQIQAVRDDSKADDLTWVLVGGEWLSIEKSYEEIMKSIKQATVAER